MDFLPLTPLVGVSGSSYKLQLGKKEGFVALSIYWKEELINMNSFRDMTFDKIDVYKIISQILSVISIPHINTYNIDRSVRLLIRYLEKNRKIEN